MPVRVLSWNLKHGRAVPSAGHDLFDEFAAVLAGWDWDVALLQEVPPWWPPGLATRTGAESRHVLTSRNALLGLRRPLAVRWPDLMKSNGGGANALLVRGGSITAHGARRLCRWPERRWMHAAEVNGGTFGAALWVGNLHATAHQPKLAARDNRLAARVLVDWAGEAPAVLGGDFNLRHLDVPGFTHAGGHDVDHVFVRGLTANGSVEVLERGHLSDHAPVVATVVI